MGEVKMSKQPKEPKIERNLDYNEEKKELTLTTLFVTDLVHKTEIMKYGVEGIKQLYKDAKAQKKTAKNQVKANNSQIENIQKAINNLKASGEAQEGIIKDVDKFLIEFKEKVTNISIK